MRVTRKEQEVCECNTALILHVLSEGLHDTMIGNTLHQDHDDSEGPRMHMTSSIKETRTQSTLHQRGSTYPNIKDGITQCVILTQYTQG